MFGNSFVTNNANPLFGNSNQSQGIFGAQQTMTGTQHKYNPVNSTDTIQKAGTNISLQTKIHSISAMPEYESKSFEELRLEDYQANRKGGTTMFGNTNMFGNSNTSFTNFGSTISSQPAQSNFGNTPSLFNTSNTQLNTTFNNKPLFGTSTNTTTSTFGNFGTANKPMFGNVNSVNPTANKPLFGSSVTSNTPTLFGNTSNQNTNVFGANTQPTASTNSFFGGLNKVQTTQSIGFFGNTNSPQTSTFAFNNPATSTSGGLFGTQNNTAKPFGSTQNTFGGFSTNTTSSSLFGNTAPTGGLFGQQNQQQTAFGVTSKPSTLFLSANTYNASQPAAITQSLFQPTQSTSAFGTANSLFGQQKPVNTFGASSNLFNPVSQQGQLFGTNTIQPSTAFGNYNQNIGTGVFSNTVPVNPTAPIGYNDANEALLQQKMIQQRFLSLVGNRPYGVNQLFIGGDSYEKISSESLSNGNRTNGCQSTTLALAIKRNDSEQLSNRRRMLNPKHSVKNLNKIFSGFDDDDEILSNKSQATVDKFFLNKRENWKYLPPNAFEKSQRSINSNNSLISENSSKKENNILDYSSSSVNINKSKFKEQKCSTPLSNNSIKKVEIIVSPIENKTYNNQNNDNIITSTDQDISKGINKSVETFTDGDQVHRDNSNVKLTKSGYYTAPKLDVLDKLISTSKCGDKECWVENFIIGRKGYGWIKFLNDTNVYGLDLDELVEIKNCEICVYPNDDEKPDIGEGLNKQAQVGLHKVYPTDKTTGEKISDPQKLDEIKFGEKLKQKTTKMNATFIEYRPEDGLWIFQVEHFSKYKFDDTESDEEVDTQHSDTTYRCNNLKKESHTSCAKVNEVVTAEADSMSDNTNLIGTFKNFNNSGYSKMRHVLFSHDNGDEKDDGSEIDFLIEHEKTFGKSRYSNIKKDLEEPMKKRFETTEMGKSIMNSSLSVNNDQVKALVHFSTERNYQPHKEVAAEPIAETKLISPSQNLSKKVLPRDYKRYRAVGNYYIPDRLVDYIKIQTSHFFENEMYQTNRFQLNLSHSTKGLIFFTKENLFDSSKLNISPTKRLQRKLSNYLHIKKVRYLKHFINDQCLKEAFSVSIINESEAEKYPYMTPKKNLIVLNKFANIELFEHGSEQIKRIFSLCKALWGKNASDDVEYPEYLQHLIRKQALSIWIRKQSKTKLINKLNEFNKIKSNNLCFEVILESLCSGELSLAAKLSALTKQHRLSVIISHISGNNFKYREILRDQLQLWVDTGNDKYMNVELLKIYILLSGQVSAVLSNGTVLYPLKGKSWWQALGCYMWFVQPYLASIRECIEVYEDEIKYDSELPVPRPFSTEDVNDDSDDYYLDVCFHLIKLFCNAAYDLDKVLNPSSIGLDIEHKLAWDWFESWHLAFLLYGYGYNVITWDRICVEYSSQLERMNFWGWSAFVLSHIKESVIRRKCLYDVLSRNVSYSKYFTEQEKFVIDVLQIHSSVVYEAKALKAKSMNDFELEAFHLMQAEKFGKSHNIYVNKVIPKLIISDKFKIIQDILEKFVKTGISNTLPDWVTGGQIYLTYIGLQSTLKSLKLTNTLANHSVLFDSQNSLSELLGEDIGNIDVKIDTLKIKAHKLMNLVNNISMLTNEQRICKNHMTVICQKVIDYCSME